MDIVIRAKDEKRAIIQDALGLFKTDGEKSGFPKAKIEVKVWDSADFEMDGVKQGLVKCFQFITNWKLKTKPLN